MTKATRRNTRTGSSSGEGSFGYNWSASPNFAKRAVARIVTAVTTRSLWVLSAERRSHLEEHLERAGDMGRVEAALGRIAAAMAQEPEWVSGTTSGATRLARTLPGTIVAKYGAEGVLCVAHLERGMAVALKVADGNSRALMPALLAVAADLAWLGPDAATALRDLAEPILRGRVGQVVGALRVRRG